MVKRGFVQLCLTVWMLLGAVAVVPASASTIYSNFGSGGSYDTGNGRQYIISSSHAVGASFQAGTNIQFLDAQLALASAGGDSTVVYLASDNSGQPGAILDTLLQQSPVGPSGSIVTFTCSTCPTLSAGTRYWIISTFGNGQILWFFNNTGPQGAAINNNGFSPNGPWSSFSNFASPAFAVNGASLCGNATVETGEQCDDGNLTAGDGCSATCTIEPGYSCTNQSGQPSVCTPVCGDGVKTADEQCDDGNTTNGDGCRANCTIERCGDGLKDPQEQCDDGNTINGDGCNATCTLPQCGNNIVDPGEQCDDGNQVGGDGCSATCRREICGNGILDPHEQCDDSNTVSGDGCRANCTVEVCGDQMLDQGEHCDDGNTVAGDGCRANCTIERCGDEIADPQEHCDDGNTVGGDGCRVDCTLERCGDAILDPQEQCDDGNTVSDDGCQANCTLPKCGDGVQDSGEQCDDANNTAGDGCSTSCQLEICGNGVTDLHEQCDDGNLTNGDGCSGLCMIEQRGGQGCSPGFWKHARHFRSWKQFSPTQNYGTVFGVQPSFNKTLLGALQQGGGGEKALGRQAVAALLNAANTRVNYAFTVQHVIGKVQQAYATRNFEVIKKELEKENERACPLQRGDDDDDEDDDHHPHH